MNRYAYWREALECAFEGCGLWDAIKDIPSAKLDELGESLATSAECESMAFHVPENPLRYENDKLAKKLRWERERESCGQCNGHGRISYNAGPWAVNTGCDKCHGEGKVHPRGEREPA
jgi:hypothetical protein